MEVLLLLLTIVISILAVFLMILGLFYQQSWLAKFVPGALATWRIDHANLSENKI